VSNEPTYPLAPQGVFLTLNGEGLFSGVPQVFVRTAGCPVACPECDTNYSFAERVSLDELTRRVVAVATPATEWVWVTGGEPAVHALAPLCGRLHALGFRVALATSGIREVPRGNAPAVGLAGFDFVSVSPHKVDESWVLRRGEQLNVVPGLNGLTLDAFEGVDVSGFVARFVTPCWYGPGDRMERVAECAEWVRAHPGWRLGIQAHKAWGIS